MSKQNITQSIEAFDRKLESHIKEYLATVEATIDVNKEYFLTNLQDCMNEGFDDVVSLFNDCILGGFKSRGTWHQSIKYASQAFYGFDGSEFDSSYELTEALEDIVNENELSIKDDDTDDKEQLFDKLKELGLRLHLTNSNDTQTEILRLLSDEFNINLIAVPQGLL